MDDDDDGEEGEEEGEERFREKRVWILSLKRDLTRSAGDGTLQLGR